MRLRRSCSLCSANSPIAWLCRGYCRRVFSWLPLRLSLGAQSAHYGVVLSSFGLSGLGVAAFHPEAARKAYLASGDRRTTGMSLFSVGGGLGFAMAPALTTVAYLTWGTAGLLALLLPAGDHRRPARLFFQPCVRADPPHASVGPTLGGHDDWRAFGILSGATICRSIVFYGLNTFLALYFMTAGESPPARETKRSSFFWERVSSEPFWGAGWPTASVVGRSSELGSPVPSYSCALFLLVTSRNLALVVLVPLAVFIFMPTSVLVVLGQEYLPQRVGVASGVTLGLAVSVGGMCAPLLGRLASARPEFRARGAFGHADHRESSGICLAACSNWRKARASTRFDARYGRSFGLSARFLGENENEDGMAVGRVSGAGAGNVC